MLYFLDPPFCLYSPKLIRQPFYKIFEQQMLTIIAIIILTFQVSCQYGIVSFLYIHTFSYYSDDIPHAPMLAAENIQLVWRQPQQNIINSSFALSEFKISYDLDLMSYEAWLSDVSSIGAQFNLQILQGCHISIIKFTAILLKANSGITQLEFINIYPKALNGWASGTSSENYVVNLNKPVCSTLSQCKAEVMIAAIAQTGSKNSSTLVNILAATPAPGQTSQSVTISTITTIQNTFNRICFTYIYIDMSSFNETLSYWSPGIYLSAIVANNFTTIYNHFSVSKYNPYSKQKCIFGVKRFHRQDTTGSSQKFLLRDSGTEAYTNYSSIDAVGIVYLQLTRYCIRHCEDSEFIDYSRSTHSCHSCASEFSSCYSCNRTICLSCQQNYFLASAGSCAKNCPSGYLGNITTFTCQTCLNISCTCPIGFNLVSQICTNITGCITVTMEAGEETCQFCNVVQKFQLVGSQCSCIQGFQLVNSKCFERCGDGLVFTAACDDGNNLDGDGCASDCSVQSNYVCTSSGTNSSSTCQYSKKDITLSVVRIDKVSLKNQGIFVFQIKPNLLNLFKLNFTNNTIFQCNLNSSIAKVEYLNSQLIIYVDFFEDLQGNQANVTVYLENSYFSQTTATLNFQMISNGVKLMFLKDFSKLQTCKEVILAFSIVVMAMFFISLFSHKMIGVELLHCFQIIFLIHLKNRNYTQVYSLIRMFTLTAFDFLHIQNNFSSFRNQKIQCSTSNQELTLYAIVGISSAPAFIFIIIKVLFVAQQAQVENKLNKSLRILYNNFLYPFTMGTLIISFLVFPSIATESTRFYSFLYIIQIFIIAFIFFFQFKHIFLQCSSNLKGCKNGYIPMYLLSILCTTFLLCISYMSQSVFPTTAILLFQYAFVLFGVILYQPYHLCTHNIGVFMNIMVVFSFLVWSCLKDFGIIASSEDEILYLFVILLLIAIQIIVMIARILYELKRKWVRLYRNCQRKSDRKQKNKIVQQQNDRFGSLLHQQQNYLSKIEAGSLMKYNNIKPALFIPQRQQLQPDGKIPRLNIRYKIQDNEVVAKLL